jgi:hypothetical protein
MGTRPEEKRTSEEVPDHYIVVGKRCVAIQGNEVRAGWFTARAWGGWRVDLDLTEGPVQIRVGTLDGARLLSGAVVLDPLGAVVQDLRVLAYRQDRSEVRVSHLGRFWVGAPDSRHWAPVEVRDLSASGAALIMVDPPAVVRLRGEVHTEHGHRVEFEGTGCLVRLADTDDDAVVAVYALELDDAQRSALRAAVLWETSAKRG